MGKAGRVMRFIPAVAVGLSALVFAAPRASATGTSSTFALTGGSLSITQPGTASLGSAPTGSLTLSGSLGSVSVTDTRGNLTATWTASVSATNFTTGGATQYETVTNGSIAYSSGTATTTGLGTFTPGLLTGLSAQGTAGGWVGTGNNTATWDPTITFTLSPSQVAGTYTGTITHSVA